MGYVENAETSGIQPCFGRYKSREAQIDAHRRERSEKRAYRYGGQENDKKLDKMILEKDSTKYKTVLADY